MVESLQISTFADTFKISHSNLCVFKEASGLGCWKRIKSLVSDLAIKYFLLSIQQRLSEESFHFAVWAPNNHTSKANS